MLSYGNLDCAVTGYVADVLPIDCHDVALHAAPLSHGSGFQALANVARGAANVILLPPPFRPSKRLPDNRAVPHNQCVCGAEAIERYDLSSPRHVVYGGTCTT
jgi:long-chain acyl-CoA synthetase